MLSNFQLFKKQLDESLDLVDAALGADGGAPFEVPENIDSFPDTQSLLARCESACKKHEKGKPTIRIIHHFACSGGTLISRCLSSMPNVFLLSEVHPHSELYLLHKGTRYLPSDIGTLAKYSGIRCHNPYILSHLKHLVPMYKDLKRKSWLLERKMLLNQLQIQ